MTGGSCTSLPCSCSTQCKLHSSSVSSITFSSFYPFFSLNCYPLLCVVASFARGFLLSCRLSSHDSLSCFTQCKGTAFLAFLQGNNRIVCANSPFVDVRQRFARFVDKGQFADILGPFGGFFPEFFGFSENNYYLCAVIVTTVAL